VVDHASDDPAGPSVRPLRAVIRAALTDALEQAGWVQTEAAAALGISPRVLNYKMRAYGVARPLEYRHDAEESVPLREIIRATIEDALDETAGDLAGAAHLLDITPRVLAYTMRSLGIARSPGRFV
jgi:transcriptional regulator with GAF, ATPase, and Fis domain